MNTRAEILEILIETVKACNATNNITESTTFNELQIDSLDAIEIIMELEEKLCTDLGDDVDGLGDKAMGQIADEIVKKICG